MLDLTSAKAGRLLSVTETNIEQRKAIAGLADDDIPRITSLKSMIEQRADHCAEVFFQSCRQDRRAPNSLLGAPPSTRPSSASATVHAGRLVVNAGEGRGRPRAEHRAGDRGGASRHDRIFLHGR
jgi:hypothetical protein